MKNKWISDLLKVPKSIVVVHFVLGLIWAKQIWRKQIKKKILDPRRDSIWDESKMENKSIFPFLFGIKSGPNWMKNKRFCIKNIYGCAVRNDCTAHGYLGGGRDEAVDEGRGPARVVDLNCDKPAMRSDFGVAGKIISGSAGFARTKYLKVLITKKGYEV